MPLPHNRRPAHRARWTGARPPTKRPGPGSERRGHDFWGGSGSVACQEFITQLGRNFQVIYEQANQHGQKVQTAGNNMNSTDNAVGGSWA